MFERAEQRFVGHKERGGLTLYGRKGIMAVTSNRIEREEYAVQHRNEETEHIEICPTVGNPT
jgi:hypothetical protein